MKETPWPTKPKIFTLRSFKKKCADLCRKLSFPPNFPSCPGSVPGLLDSHSSRVGYCYHPHFADKAAEAQRGSVTCPGSPSKARAELGLEPGPSQAVPSASHWPDSSPPPGLASTRLWTVGALGAWPSPDDSRCMLFSSSCLLPF